MTTAPSGRLTDDLARRLRQVGPDYATWSEADRTAWSWPRSSAAGTLAGVIRVGGSVAVEPAMPTGAGDVDLAERQRIAEQLSLAGATDGWSGSHGPPPTDP